MGGGSRLQGRGSIERGKGAGWFGSGRDGFRPLGAAGFGAAGV